MKSYIIKGLENKVQILMVEKKEKTKINYLLTKLLESSADDVFYNINVGDDEISIVLDIKFKNIYKNINCTFDQNIYNVIQIHVNKSGIDHIGTISEISTLFTDINIPILYFNTYKYNFILVKEKDYKIAIDALDKLLNN